jgi:hypothetical protein
MDTLIETDYSEYNDHNMVLSDNQGPEQQMALSVDSKNSWHSSTAGKGDSALTACLRSKKQDTTLTGTQHTISTFDTFAEEGQERQDDDDVSDDESIVSIDINVIKTDFIDLSSYNEGAVDEDLKWTEGFMGHDDDSDEESIEEPSLLHDSMSSFLNEALFENLTNCMERSALSRQLVRQYSEKSFVGSTTSTEISLRSFNHNDSLHLQNPLGPSSCHSTSGSDGGLIRPPIKKAQGGSKRSGLIRRHSHRSLSGQDLTKIDAAGNSSWRNLSRSSSFRKTNVKRVGRQLDQDFLFAAPKLKP